MPHFTPYYDDYCDHCNCFGYECCCPYYCPAGVNGATGPTGATGATPPLPTQQFRSVGTAYSSQSIPIGITTNIRFNQLFAHNGTDITGITPGVSSDTLTLAGVHSYFITYSHSPISLQNSLQPWH